MQQQGVAAVGGGGRASSLKICGPVRAELDKLRTVDEIGSSARRSRRRSAGRSTAREATGRAARQRRRWNSAAQAKFGWNASGSSARQSARAREERAEKARRGNAAAHAAREAGRS